MYKMLVRVWILQLICRYETAHSLSCFCLFISSLYSHCGH